MAMIGTRGRTRSTIARLCVCAIALAAPALVQAQLITIDPMADSLGKLRRTSTFAFQARIDSLHASTVKGIARSSHTIAVTPSASLQCPHAVGLYSNEPVTVYVEDTTGLAPQQEWWFFASGWIIG